MLDKSDAGELTVSSEVGWRTEHWLCTYEIRTLVLALP
jgi:hypothetical protein